MAVLRLVCAGLCIVLGSAQAPALGPSDKLPPIQLADLDGGEVEVDAGGPALIIVEFWATWCLPCRTTLPAVAALAKKYSETVHVYAVGIDRDADAAKAFLREYLPEMPPSMTVLHDPGGELLARFGAAGMPALYVAERGVVAFVEAGAKPDLVDRLRAFLEKRSAADR